MQERSPGRPEVAARRRQSLVEARSAKAPSARLKASPSPDLLKGQIWKVKETYVQIVDAGKTLIHYTMSPKPRQRGLRVQMATRETVQGFLKSNQAKLIAAA